MDDLDAPRTCARCRRTLPLRQYPLRRKDGTKRYGHCIDCKAAYQRQWYARNAERHRAMTAARRAKVRQVNKEVVRTAKQKPCADCGRRYPPYVMDFDHVRGTKIDNVSLLKTYATTAALMWEIAKCDVVCANCHRTRSHVRRTASSARTTTQKRPQERTFEQLRIEWVAGGSNSEPWA